MYCGKIPITTNLPISIDRLLTSKRPSLGFCQNISFIELMAVVQNDRILARRATLKAGVTASAAAVPLDRSALAACFRCRVSGAIMMMTIVGSHMIKAAMRAGHSPFCRSQKQTGPLRKRPRTGAVDIMTKAPALFFNGTVISFLKL